MSEFTVNVSGPRGHGMGAFIDTLDLMVKEHERTGDRAAVAMIFETQMCKLSRAELSGFGILAGCWMAYVLDVHPEAQDFMKKSEPYLQLVHSARTPDQEPDQ